MPMTDLAASEKVVARILARLAPNGVNRVTLTLAQIDPGGELGISERLFIDAMHWLAAERIIRFETERRSTQVRIRGCVLTADGFSRLGRRFQIGDESITVGEGIGRVDRSEAFYAQTGNFFGGLLGAFTKSVS